MKKLLLLVLFLSCQQLTDSQFIKKTDIDSVIYSIFLDKLNEQDNIGGLWGYAYLVKDKTIQKKIVVDLCFKANSNKYNFLQDEFNTPFFYYIYNESMYYVFINGEWVKMSRLAAYTYIKSLLSCEPIVIESKDDTFTISSYHGFIFVQDSIVKEF